MRLFSALAALAGLLGVQAHVISIGIQLPLEDPRECVQGAAEVTLLPYADCLFSVGARALPCLSFPFKLLC